MKKQGMLPRVEWLEAAVRRLQKRTTVGGGGVPTSTVITEINGFPGDPSVVLLGDGTFGPALSGGGGQWLPVPNANGTMSLTSGGHPVLVWWDGP